MLHGRFAISVQPATGNLPARTQAAVYQAFADVLIPGDADFPSASSVGAHGPMADRLREVGGAEVLDRLAMGLSNQGILDDAVRATAALEAMDPALFDMARVALTYAYYETPAVIEAIRGLGFPYNHAPQPDGYIMRDFDPAIDAPKVPRGHYVATEDVRRVDLTKLDFLNGDRS